MFADNARVARKDCETCQIKVIEKAIAQLFCFVVVKLREDALPAS